MRARRDASVHGLKFRLLAAVSGVTVTVACAGRSTRHATDPRAGGGADTPTTAGAGGSALGGGTGGAGANGGTSGRAPLTPGGNGGASGTGGSSANTGQGGAGPGGAGGSAGGTSIAGAGGSAGAPISGAGGTAGAAPHATLGCTATETYGPGLVSCTGLFVHRQGAVACPQAEHDDASNSAAGAGGEGGDNQGFPCMRDADCHGANNYCVIRGGAGVPPNGTCLNSCVTDADCGPGSICACDPGTFLSLKTRNPLTLGLCTASTCVTDADCDAGLLCIAPTTDLCGPTNPIAFHCQNPYDQCSGADDCRSLGPGGSFSCINDGGGYKCERGQCGRPFLVNGEARLSAPLSSAEWRDRTPVPNRLASLDNGVKALLAEHFTQAALMEHASIAAFARFTLQLLAFGAPAELVALAAEATADETRHARQCFELASRYAGRDLGPAPLDVDGALEHSDLAAVVELVVEEGCVGETAAALEASWAAEAATDPLVRDVLTGIAADEERHAALAFRFVAWTIERDPRLLDRVKARVEALARKRMMANPEAELHAAELREYGVLSAAERRLARATALDDIIPAVLASIESSPRSLILEARARIAQ